MSPTAPADDSASPRARAGLGERMDGLAERVGNVAELFDGLTERTEGGFTQVGGALDATAARQAHIVEVLDQLIRRDS